MVMGLFATAVLLLLVSGVPGALVLRGNAGERISVVLMLCGAGLGLAAALLSLFGQPGRFSLPWSVPGGALLLHLDAIAALFLLPIFLIGALGSVYGLGYWPQNRHPRSGVRLRLFYGILAGSMALVVTSANSIFFLFCWEIMALAAFFLVVIEDANKDVRKAGFIYLTAAHVGALALFALFALMGEEIGSFAFPAAGTLSVPTSKATLLFLLGLFGFGLKAGMMPLHIWLPGAHAAAPSHVSAILSGVVLKTGIYGLVRLTSFFEAIPPWWGWTILVLGIASGVIGVAFAIAQHDLKRLLAYHSVENIGIICIGLGLALLGRSYGLDALVFLGMAGALLHVINHSLFKSLLFFGAGSVLHSGVGREIDCLGGLLRKMPWTAAFFLGGAVAIIGLPPLNGFVSEWLIYLGLFKSLEGDLLPARLAILAAPALALIGALALACFVKVFGAVFLGTARTPPAEEAREAPLSMLVPMGVLFFFCTLIGLLPWGVIPLLSEATTAWIGTSAQPNAIPYELSSAFVPATALTTSALALLALIAVIALLLRRFHPREAPRVPTWGCGFTRPNPRMQYTASSFGEMLVGLFRWSLFPQQHGVKANGLFPTRAEFSSHTPDTVLDRLLLPLMRLASKVSTRVRSVVQCGSTSLYLFYVALTLGVLLVLSSLPGGGS